MSHPGWIASAEFIRNVLVKNVIRKDCVSDSMYRDDLRTSHVVSDRLNQRLNSVRLLSSRIEAVERFHQSLNLIDVEKDLKARVLVRSAERITRAYDEDREHAKDNRNDIPAERTTRVEASLVVKIHIRLRRALDRVG